MPLPVPAILLGGGFIAGLLLLNKREKDAATSEPAALPSATVTPVRPGSGLPSIVPPPIPVPASPSVLPPLPGNLFPAAPFPGRPAPITVAERERILAKPPGTLTAPEVANLTVDFTPQQTAVLNTIGTPGLFAESEAGPMDRSEAIRQGVPLAEMLKRTGGPIALPRAMVTTKDPSPSGDLIIRSAPNATAPQKGGAPKNGIVTVVNMNAAPGFAEIAWSGGPTYPGVRGFARSQFLVIQ